MKLWNENAHALETNGSTAPISLSHLHSRLDANAPDPINPVPATIGFSNGAPEAAPAVTYRGDWSKGKTEGLPGWSGYDAFRSFRVFLPLQTKPLTRLQCIAVNVRYPAIDHGVYRAL